LVGNISGLSILGFPASRSLASRMCTGWRFLWGCGVDVGGGATSSVPFWLWGLPGSTTALSAQRKITTHALLITWGEKKSVVLGAHFKHGWWEFERGRSPSRKPGVPTMTQLSDKKCNLGCPSQIIPCARRCLRHVIGQCTTPLKNVWKQSVKSHNGHLPCWVASRTLYLVGKYSPPKKNPVGKWDSAKKILAGPLFKKKIGAAADP